MDLKMKYNRRTFLQGLSAASMLKFSGVTDLPGMLSYSSPVGTGSEPGQIENACNLSRLTVAPRADELAEVDAWLGCR